MLTRIEPSAPEKLADANLKPRGRVYPSPVAWRDQILYFLLPDRFSNGQETPQALFDPANPQQHKADKAKWMEAGKTFQGGILKGITSKLGYIKKLGATALWVGPVWRQRSDLQTYHGYAIQNFLDVDPRFGTRQDLRNLVDAAHDKKMYVLLDIIYNHSGNNWFYRSDDNKNLNETMPYRFTPQYNFGQWRSKTGTPTEQIADAEDGVLPTEFQNPKWYTRAGQIGRWDPAPWENPLHPDCEFRRGDFFDLKDLEQNDDEVLNALIRVYEYWIGLSDCDGFRIDTVKHTTFEGSRNFCGAVREYTESIGKENFLLLGEVTGGSKMIVDYLEIFGRNIDAALDIGTPADRIADMVKGYGNPQDFFNEFGGQDAFGSHRIIGRYHVSILDDHDMVMRRGGKRRFIAGNQIPNKYQQVAHAVGVQLTTLGIPCIYYGTEQAFDGSEDMHDAKIEPTDQNGVPNADRYIRECMFASNFGAFQTENCHFFNPKHPTYIRIAAINAIRNRKDAVGLALRRGRQYLRDTSTNNGAAFRKPMPGELVGWSRICFNQEVLTVLNTHGTEEKSALVSLDARFHPENSTMTTLYRGDWTDQELANTHRAKAAVSVTVQYVNGVAAVNVTLPPAGMTILA